MTRVNRISVAFSGVKPESVPRILDATEQALFAEATIDAVSAPPPDGRGEVTGIMTLSAPRTIGYSAMMPSQDLFLVGSSGKRIPYRIAFYAIQRFAELGDNRALHFAVLDTSANFTAS